MRSPSKTQPITMKELDRTRIQRAESSPKTKRSWRTQRARRAQRALSTECLCPYQPKGGKLDKEKYMRLVSEYKKFKKTACRHFRFNPAGNFYFGKFKFPHLKYS